ncbi:neurexin-1b-alpha-like, partial [Tropilaelaps mercedesae]
MQTRKHKQLQQLADFDDEADDETAEAGVGGASADVKIQLGGVLSGSTSAAVSKGFRGVLSGVVLNGVRLLELSTERGDIVVQGDATRLQSLAQSKYSPAHNYPADQPLMLNDAKPPVEVYERDDLVYSEGSGCYESDDDDADCNNNDDSSNSAGGGDELVTAVYIPSQRRSSAPHYNGNAIGSSGGVGGTTSRPSQKKTIYSCHDDEDCVEEGSGNGVDGAGSRIPSSGIIVTPRAPYESPNNGGGAHQTTTTTARTTTSSYSTTSTTPSPPTTTTTHEWIIVKTFSTRQPFRPRTTSTGIPEVFSVPIPEVHVPTQINKNKSKTKPARVDAAAAADGTALVIGIVTGILVSLVILALLLYRFRTVRPGGACKPNSLYYNPCVAVGESGPAGSGGTPGLGAPMGAPGLGGGGPGSGGGTCIPYGVTPGGGMAGGAPAYSTLHKGMAVAGAKKTEPVKDPQECQSNEQEDKAEADNESEREMDDGVVYTKKGDEVFPRHRKRHKRDGDVRRTLLSLEIPTHIGPYVHSAVPIQP